MVKYCALMAAAKMGLRHNIMKPLLALNGSTVVKNTVESLRTVGCDPLIVVSGRNSQDLIRHLGRKNITHVINPDYSGTDMYFSLRMGLEQAPADIDYIFFLPADVPLMNSSGLLLLMDYMQQHPGCDVLRPSRRGHVGHPVLMKRHVGSYLLNWRGRGGLREALAAYGGSSQLIELDDEGMQLDVDRQEDFACFQAYAEAQAQLRPLNCRADIILGRDRPFFNSLLAELLRQIEASGSLSTACERVNISYSNGWKSIKSAEIQLGFALLSSSRGGSNGGESTLTAAARKLLQRYEALENKFSQLCQEDLLQITSEIS